MLASSIIQGLQDAAAQDGNTSVCYYFFQADGSNALGSLPTAAYRTILSQLLHKNRHNEHIIDKFAFQMIEGSGQMKASQSDLIELLHLCCQDLGPVYIVLDGLDECSDVRALLVQAVAKISALSSVRILLLGRPSTPTLHRKTLLEQRIPLGRLAVNDDIRTYLTSKVTALIDEGYLPDVELESLVDPLMSGADGMYVIPEYKSLSLQEITLTLYPQTRFLWAILMIRLLHSPVLTPSRRLRTITNIVYPEGIEKMYCRILSIIVESGSLQRAAAKQIFCWLAFARMPLTIGLLYEAVHKNRLGSSADSVKEVQAFRETISVVCGALVEFYDPASGHVEQQPLVASLGAQTGVKFIHLSVAEHFLQSHTMSDNSTGTFTMERSLANLTLALETVGALLWAEPTSSIFNSDLSKYSVLYWTKHIHASIEQGISVDLARSGEFRHTLLELFKSLSNFLENPLAITRWIYSFYKDGGSLVQGKLPCTDFKNWLHWFETSDLLEQAQSSQRTIQRMKEFLHDMERLVREWHPKLHSDPDIIWDDAASFSDSIFLYKKDSSTRIKRLALIDLKRPNQSSRPLGEISASSSDGKLNFRLSIWPSKAFEERWGSLQVYDSIARVKDVSCGWSMRYEAWSIEAESCLGEIEIPLDEQEIWLAMRQMLYEKDLGN